MHTAKVANGFGDPHRSYVDYPTDVVRTLDQELYPHRATSIQAPLSISLSLPLEHIPSPFPKLTRGRVLARLLNIFYQFSKG
jgi:hypothetical protein